MIVRDAHEADMPAVCAIYNATVPTSTAAWTEELQAVEDRRAWFHEQTRSRHPVLVADADDAVVGFASYGSFRGAGRWPGYRYTVEHSIHVARSHWGTGIGRQLLERLIERAAAQGMHVMIAAVSNENTESIAFHERLGFHEVARMPQVGRKFDRWLDLVLLQRILDERL